MKTSGYHITIGNATDIGKVRTQNEDYLAHFDTMLGYCVIVCDGMGGHAAGDVASQTAVATIRQFLQDPGNAHAAVPVAMRNAIEFANFQLRGMVEQNPSLNGMGTTCVLALIRQGQLYTAHVGDSRLYLVRNGAIEQLTKDHSTVQKLIDIGVLTEEEAMVSDKRNQISKAIGIFEKADPSVTAVPADLQENDKILLCSDGLTGHVSKEQILAAFSDTEDMQDVALQLVGLANSDGGTDNITVQVVHYTGKTMTGRKKRGLQKWILALLAAAILALGFVGYRKLINGAQDALPVTDPGKKDSQHVNRDQKKIQPKTAE